MSGLAYSVELDASADEIADVLSNYGHKIMPVARVAATNKLMAQARTHIRGQTAKAANIPSRQLSKRFVLHKAKKSQKLARLFIGTKGMPVVNIKSHARRSTKGAFKQTMPSGHKGIFKRRSGRRLPIDEVRVEFHAIAKRIAKQYMSGIAPKKFDDIFRSELSFRTKREVERIF